MNSAFPQNPINDLETNLSTSPDTKDCDSAEKQRAIEATRIQELRTLTNSLPLSEEKYQLLNRRLENSQSYVNSGQFTAARFEMKHVVASLKKMFDLKSLLQIWVAASQK